MSMNFGLDSNSIRRTNFVPPTQPTTNQTVNRPVKVGGTGFGVSMFQRINVNTSGGGGCGCGK